MTEEFEEFFEELEKEKLGIEHAIALNDLNMWILHEFKGMSDNEIAKRLGIDRSSIGKRRRIIEGSLTWKFVLCMVYDIIKNDELKFKKAILEGRLAEGGNLGELIVLT